MISISFCLFHWTDELSLYLWSAYTHPQYLRERMHWSKETNWRFFFAYCLFAIDIVQVAEIDCRLVGQECSCGLWWALRNQAKRLKIRVPLESYSVFVFRHDKLLPRAESVMGPAQPHSLRGSIFEGVGLNDLSPGDRIRPPRQAK